MANWLENEERKKLILTQRQNLIHKNLKRFYDICKRVNNVILESGVIISDFEVEGRTKKIIRERTWLNGGDHSDEIFFNRGIRFGIFHEDEMILEVITKQYSFKQYSSKFGHLNNIAIHIRNKLFPQELIDWNEEKMLNLIQWLLFELDSVRETLPGQEIASEPNLIKSSLESDLSKLNRNLAIERLKLSKIKEWKFNRIRRVRERQILKQQGIIHPLKIRINEIIFELKERFMIN